MAAGGTWTAQTQKRPGAYINFVGTPKSLAGVGVRGTLATPLPLPWGAEIVELTAQDLVTGASLEKAGVLFGDDEALNLRLALQSCQKAVVYRTNAATAAKATGQIADGELNATAKFGGTLGNSIRITMDVDFEADITQALRPIIPQNLQTITDTTTATAAALFVNHGLTTTLETVPPKLETVRVNAESFGFWLLDVGASKLEVIKAVKTEYSLGLQDAKNLVDSTPVILKNYTATELPTAWAFAWRLEDVSVGVKTSFVPKY